jgi:hypothetical protein
MEKHKLNIICQWEKELVLFHSIVERRDISLQNLTFNFSIPLHICQIECFHLGQNIALHHHDNHCDSFHLDLNHLCLTNNHAKTNPKKRTIESSVSATVAITLEFRWALSFRNARTYGFQMEFNSSDQHSYLFSSSYKPYVAWFPFSSKDCRIVGLSLFQEVVAHSSPSSSSSCLLFPQLMSPKRIHQQHTPYTYDMDQDLDISPFSYLPLVVWGHFNPIMLEKEKCICLWIPTSSPNLNQIEKSLITNIYKEIGTILNNIDFNIGNVIDVIWTWFSIEEQEAQDDLNNIRNNSNVFCDVRSCCTIKHMATHIDAISIYSYTQIKCFIREFTQNLLSQIFYSSLCKIPQWLSIALMEYFTCKVESAQELLGIDAVNKRWLIRGLLLKEYHYSSKKHKDNKDAHAKGAIIEEEDDDENHRILDVRNKNEICCSMLQNIQLHYLSFKEVRNIIEDVEFFQDDLFFSVEIIDHYNPLNSQTKHLLQSLDDPHFAADQFLVPYWWSLRCKMAGFILSSNLNSNHSIDQRVCQDGMEMILQTIVHSKETTFLMKNDVIKCAFDKIESLRKHYQTKSVWKYDEFISNWVQNVNWPRLMIEFEYIKTNKPANNNNNFKNVAANQKKLKNIKTPKRKIKGRDLDEDEDEAEEEEEEEFVQQQSPVESERVNNEIRKNRHIKLHYESVNMSFPTSSLSQGFALDMRIQETSQVSHQVIPIKVRTATSAYTNLHKAYKLVESKELAKRVSSRTHGKNTSAASNERTCYISPDTPFHQIFARFVAHPVSYIRPDINHNWGFCVEVTNMSRPMCAVQIDKEYSLVGKLEGIFRLSSFIYNQFISWASTKTSNYISKDFKSDKNGYDNPNPEYCHKVKICSESLFRMLAKFIKQKDLSIFVRINSFRMYIYHCIFFFHNYKEIIKDEETMAMIYLNQWGLPVVSLLEEYLNYFLNYAKHVIFANNQTKKNKKNKNEDNSGNSDSDNDDEDEKKKKKKQDNIFDHELYYLCCTILPYVCFLSRISPSIEEKLMIMLSHHLISYYENYNILFKIFKNLSIQMLRCFFNIQNPTSKLSYLLFSLTNHVVLPNEIIMICRKLMKHFEKQIASFSKDSTAANGTAAATIEKTNKNNITLPLFSFVQ